MQPSEEQEACLKEFLAKRQSVVNFQETSSEFEDQKIKYAKQRINSLSRKESQRVLIRK
jgi:hypothetical protein